LNGTVWISLFGGGQPDKTPEYEMTPLPPTFEDIINGGESIQLNLNFTISIQAKRE
jgi:hypothetical protein